MKRIFAFLLLMIVPTFCWAGWVGSVDGRRYVTDEEKGVFPYNNIVRIESKTGFSTGTIVSSNVVLTCRHCVESSGKNSNVNLHMSDGSVRTGTVWYYPNDGKDSNDFALIIFKQFDSDRFLGVSDVSVPDDKVMRIGYDTLKVLNSDEIKIVKKAFVNALKKYGNITDKNVSSAIAYVEGTLQDYNCKSDTDVNCVRCVNSNSCIFDDGERMKVQDSCSATKMQHIVDDGLMLYTDCVATPGGSGAPLIDSEHEHVIGVSTGTYGFGIGGTTESYAVRPERFYEKTKTLVNMANNGLIEF